MAQRTLVQIESPPAQPRGDQRMTAEVSKYTIEQIESLELAPGTEHETTRRLGSGTRQRR